PRAGQLSGETAPAIAEVILVSSLNVDARVHRRADVGQELRNERVRAKEDARRSAVNESARSSRSVLQAVGERGQVAYDANRSVLLDLVVVDAGREALEERRREDKAEREGSRAFRLQVDVTTLLHRALTSWALSNRAVLK